MEGLPEATTFELKPEGGEEVNRVREGASQEVGMQRP